MIAIPVVYTGPGAVDDMPTNPECSTCAYSPDDKTCPRSADGWLSCLLLEEELGATVHYQLARSDHDGQ
jgi:hypothetical protein